MAMLVCLLVLPATEGTSLSLEDKVSAMAAQMNAMKDEVQALRQEVATLRAGKVDPVAKMFKESGESSRQLAEEGGVSIELNGGETSSYIHGAAGQVGINVEPESDWAGEDSAIRIGGNGAIWAKRDQGSGKSFTMAQNVYDTNAGDTYISNDKASKYSQHSGNHKFFTASRGSAGDVATFQEKMSVNAAGASVSGGLVVGDSVQGTVTFGVARFFTSAYGSNHYYHLRMPEVFNSFEGPGASSSRSAMWHIRVTGYSFSDASKIDLTSVGYNTHRSNGGLISRSQTTGSGFTNGGPYHGTDGRLYIKFRLGDIYYSTVRVDSMRVGNGIVINPGDITITTSASAQL